MLRVYNEVNLYFHPIYVLEEDRQWSMELSEVTGDVYLDDILRLSVALASHEL